MDDSELSNLSLSQLFAKALQAASDAHDLPSIEDATQKLLTSGASALRLCQTLMNARGVFSPNEQLEDVSTRGLPFMLVDYVAAEISGRLSTKGRDDRLAALQLVKNDYLKYKELVESYEVLTEEERTTLKRGPGKGDPARRREEKIRQFKWEREVRSRLETLAQDRSSSSLSNDFDLIHSLLPSPTASSSSAASSSSSSPSLRPYTLSLITLLYSQTLASLESISQEEELLRSMPAEAARQLDDGRERDRGEKETRDDTWRLDSVRRGGPDGKGELMDAKGKPLRPFTILPSGGPMDERQRLQAEVFRSGHRLPTMSIDEYLENEFASGNVITGGGKASEDAPTSSEILQLETEQDGTEAAHEADQRQRDKGETWARFAEDNAKGSGNMGGNRG